MFSNEVLNEVAAVARRLDVEPAALAAVAHVESGMRTHAVIDGRPEPLIRFEGHYFDRRLSGLKQELARAAGLSSPEAGRIANPSSQASRWRMLARAEAIDRAAARESTSWGMGQVMGAHWAWLGYADVDALVKEARSGVGGQLRLMARYIGKAGLTPALRSRDWVAFARGYNGPGHRRNGYAGKLSRAYARYRRAGDAQAGHPPVLRRGMKGDAVRSLQRALARNGETIRQDGIFGKETERAVLATQRRHRLAEDGIVGPATRAVLHRPDSIGGWLMRVIHRVRPGKFDHSRAVQ